MYSDDWVNLDWVNFSHDSFGHKVTKTNKIKDVDFYVPYLHFRGIMLINILLLFGRILFQAIQMLVELNKVQN